MNLILLTEAELQASPAVEAARLVRFTDRRAEHIRTVHRAVPGDELRVGIVGGKIGLARVSRVDAAYVELAVAPENLTTAPPPPLNLTLLLALPRPKFLAKILQSATSLGVKRIILMNSYRVEKIYWHCEQLTPESVRDACLLGLEQARDTILPDVALKRTFKPFIEDEAPELIKGTRAFVAHPVADAPCPYGLTEPITLAVGPEGGFIDYEITKLKSAGFTAVHLSPRVLKVETAVTALISRLT